MGKKIFAISKGDNMQLKALKICKLGMTSSLKLWQYRKISMTQVKGINKLGTKTNVFGA
jgi:hypothetical protein